jgi:hypothetical protein
MSNAAVDYDGHFPPGYEAGHTGGLKLLRVAARVRADYGRDKIGPLYQAIGTQVFDTDPDERQDRGSRAFLEPILTQVGSPIALGDALEDTSFDPELRRETDEALALTGKDVGTPILHFQPPRVWRSSGQSSAACPATPTSTTRTSRGRRAHLGDAAVEP